MNTWSLKTLREEEEEEERGGGGGGGADRRTGDQCDDALLELL